jgi:hypothetical protein
MAILETSFLACLCCAPDISNTLNTTDKARLPRKCLQSFYLCALSGTRINVTNSAKFDHGWAPSRLRWKHCCLRTCCSRTGCFGRHATVSRDCIIFVATITSLEHWTKKTINLWHWGDRFVFCWIHKNALWRRRKNEWVSHFRRAGGII